MKKSIKASVGKMPIIGRVILAMFRLKSPLRHHYVNLKDTIAWLLKSKEITNYTYDLQDMNRRHLAAFVAHITGKSLDEITGYMDELASDGELRSHIRERTISSRENFVSDAEARYGRREGWYAIARAIKPSVIVETGVDKGLGACVLAAALIRNGEEGHAGRYYGTDINMEAGWLLSGKYARFGQILIGDSIGSLKKLDEKIDLFINDSWHTPEYEGGEYAAIRHKLSEDTVILGDNAHATDELMKFACQTWRSFLFFQEKPKNHWYPGGGIGAAFRRKE